MAGTQIDLDNDPENTFRILIATDNHLGFEEKDLIRGNDSYVAFDEILQHAVANYADFILLGGDLFHHANPTTNALNKCLNMLRKHTLGDNPITFEVLSDPTVNFQNVNNTINFEDPNMNVGIPVFSIHGNHDDPSGFARLSALDVLSTSGLINYFGKWTDLTKIDLHPIMMKKGETKLNIYGLSYIHDPRLVRLLKEHKVTMRRPEDDPDSWFNLMVVHQNRADRGQNNYLPENALPDFLDAVLWGHEHDCQIGEPKLNTAKGFSIIQPGSSVATSLSEGESIAKYCGLLLVNRKQFKLLPIKLQTVRPFVFRALNLNDHVKEIGEGDSDSMHNVQQFVTKIIEEMILEARNKLTDNPLQPILPLLRLRLDFSDESQMFNAIRFGQQYSDRVANSKDMVQFRKLKKRTKNDPSNFDKDAFNDVYEKEVDEKDEIRVEDIVNRYFDEVDSNKKLKVFSTAGLAELCRRLVMHEDEDAANLIIDFYKVQLCRHLKTTMPDEENITSEILNFKETKSDELVKPMFEMLDKRGAKVVKTSESFMDSTDNGESVKPTKPAAKAATTSRAGRQTKQAASNNVICLDDDDEENLPLAKTVKPARGRGSRGGRGSAATRVIKPELNVSVTRASSSTSQLTIQKSFSQSLRKPKGKIQYVDSDDDSN